MSENICARCGAVIPEGRQVCKRCEAMAEHKTADEMFRELGYEKRWRDVPTAYANNHSVNEKGGKYTIIELYDGYMIKWGYGRKGGMHDIRFTPDEILACAQLIREMGCENGN